MGVACRRTCDWAWQMSEDLRRTCGDVGGLVGGLVEMSEDLRRTCTRRVIRLTRAEVSWKCCT